MNVSYVWRFLLNEIIEIIGLIFALCVILSIIFPSLFEDKRCPKCRTNSSLNKTGKTDPADPYLLESYKIELKCKNCGFSKWVDRTAKATMGGE